MQNLNILTKLYFAKNYLVSNKTAAKSVLVNYFRYYWDSSYFVLSGDSIVESSVILLRCFYQINLDIIGIVAIL